MTRSTNCCSDLLSWMSPGFFQALADPNRVNILARLAAGGREQTVSEVASCCTVDLSVVSRHLRTLREAGIVSADKRGKQVFYRVEVDRLTSALRNLADALDACCPDGSCVVQANPVMDGESSTIGDPPGEDPTHEP
jgi:ArsR family transcriptional regulator, arsenate/arsenite/antimonite-responsive transcriptional repressor